MKGTTKKIARDYGGAVIAAVVIAILIRVFVIEAYRIPTSAMHPTLEPGDTIFVAKWPLGFNRSVERGDVLVFANPAEPDRDYIKRALAIAGDTVEVRKGHVILNGKALTSPEHLSRKDAACDIEKITSGDQPRAHEICWEQPINEDFASEKIPPGSIFVIGDLRSQSPSDLKKRKSWGIVPLDAIKGKAKWIWLSIEPHNPGMSAVRFPNFRFERMLRRIE